MTCYVDPIFEWPGKGNWCHLMCDGDLSELHAMAERLGLKRSYFQNKPRYPHYDLRPNKRALAVKAGAIEVDGGELIRRCVRKDSL